MKKGIKSTKAQFRANVENSTTAQLLPYTHFFINTIGAARAVGSCLSRLSFTLSYFLATQSLGQRFYLAEKLDKSISQFSPRQLLA
jgi:hypothetical protein